MRTLHTVMKRGAIYWDQELLPRDALRARLERVQQLVAQSGDAAWLIFGDVMRYGQLAYVSQFVPRGGWALAIVPVSGPPTLLVNAGPRDVPDTHRLTWFEDVRPLGGLPSGLVRLLGERGLLDARLGLAGARDALKVDQWHDLAAALPGVTWSEHDEMLSNMRLIKEPIELEVMRRAARSSQAGLDAAGSALQPGTTVRRALAQADHAMRYQGAEDCRLLVASGPQTARGLRPPDDRLLTEGDSVMLVAASTFQHYWVECARTYSIGAPDAEQKALVAAAEAAVQAMLEVARPGVELAELERACLASLDQVTLVSADGQGTIPGTQAPTPADYGLVHGIGLDAEEPPSLRIGFEPGSDAASRGRLLGLSETLALHVVLHGLASGAVAGTTVSLAADGARRLVQMEAGINA